jgi:flagellar hook assembly protein FlgD
VFAIWVKDAQGNFVVSRKVMANNRKQHLVKWNASSGGNSVTATTGATLSNHHTHTITWDGKNASGGDMPDGAYQIWVEYSSTNSATNGNPGPFLTVEFEKGPAIQHITPANATYFQNIVADWVPDGVAIHDLSIAGATVEVFPNPFSENVKIKLNITRNSQAFIDVYNIANTKVISLLSESITPGNYEMTWDGKDAAGNRVPAGIYLLQVNINGIKATKKVVLNR